jgi:sister-chromatid-cohesion protein PDS5
MVSYDIFLYLQDDLLRILGEKHRLYDFLSNLSVKCSYLLFNKEHVKEILLEAVTHKSSGNTQYTQSCMDILVVDTCHSYISFPIQTGFSRFT